MDSDTLYTIAQAAPLMDVAYGLLYQYVRLGAVPTRQKPGRKRNYITPQTVRDFNAGFIDVSGVFQLEKDVQRKVLKKLPAGVPAVKLHRTDWPDYMFVMPHGVVAFIEFKKKGKKPRDGQYAILRELRNQGHYAEYFDNSTKALKWLMEIYDESHSNKKR